MQSDNALDKIFGPPYKTTESVDCRFCHNFKPTKDRFFASFSLPNLVEAVRAGCTTCRLVARSICAFQSRAPQGIDIKDCDILLRNRAVSEGGPCELKALHVKNLREPTWLDLEIYSSHAVSTQLRIFGSQLRRNISEDASSPECMDLVRTWIENCTRNHALCRYRPSRLPKRVIDVGSSRQAPKLHISQGEWGRYVTLSHCWGDHRPTETTTGNIEDRKLGIPFQAFPKTFQDAILITRELNIQYLWIDSLCIIQDSREDWQSNVSSMGSVYEKSYCTIAAADAKDCRDGCFLRHVSKQATVALGNGSSVHVRRTPEEQGFNLDWSEGANHAPFHYRGNEWDPPSSALEDRAWAFQERLLSPRTLHYSRHELSFECRECICCECTTQPQKLQWDSFPPLFKLLLQPTPTASGSESNGFGREQWQKIIERYSGRTLTYNTDRLPALSGITSQFAARHRLTKGYSAGLWEQHLPRSLLWGPRLGLNPSAYPNRRHREYIAPSWSWASIAGAVTFYNDHVDSWILEVVSVEVCVQEPVLNPYGIVRGGYIEVQGWFIPILVECSDYSTYMSIKPCPLWRRQPDLDLETLRGGITIWGDVVSMFADVDVGPAEIISGQTLYILPISLKRSMVDKVHIRGLIISQTECALEYRRVGRSRIEGSSELWDELKKLGTCMCARLV